MAAKLALLALLALATPALADADADRMAAELKHHLNKHGRTFVANEAARLEIGDASDSGAKDDVREACPEPESCFATRHLNADQTQRAMYFLAANRAEHLLSAAMERLKQNPDDPHAMFSMQQAMQRWTLMNQMQSQTINQLSESLKSIIQKM